MKNLICVIIIILLGACHNGKIDQNDSEKLMNLIRPANTSLLKMAVIIPLENACSSCSQMTITKLPLLEDHHKSSILLIFTARSEKLINETLSSTNLDGFLIQKDPQYEAWKIGLVDNNPSYYLLKENKILSKGGITFQTVDNAILEFAKYLNDE